MTGQPDGSKITLEVQEESLMNVVEAFERFLKGAGFVFDGYLDFVDDADSTSYDTELDGWATDNETVFGSHYSEPKHPMEDQELAEYTKVQEKYTFKQEAGKCGRCGLTREQLGDHKCYDNYCGMK
jgi:hypothetical protein